MAGTNDGRAERWLRLARLEPHHISELVALFQTAWWTRGRKRADVERMLAGSDGVVAFTDPSGDHLLAFARFLTDGVYKATIYDVIVAESMRGRGLGRALTDALLAHPRLANVTHIELYCLRELSAFYARWGFTDDLGGVRLLRHTP